MRRRFRFSLRSLLVATAAISLGLAWYYRCVESERRAAEAIAAAGGTVKYDWQVRTPGDEKSQLVPPGPPWLRERLGRHWFDSIVHVKLHRTFVSRETRFSVLGQHLVRLRSLRSLSLWNYELSAADYFLLGRLSCIEELQMRVENRIDAPDASAIARLTRLRVLSLRDAKISTSALEELAKLPALKELAISVASFDPKTGMRLQEFTLDDRDARAIAAFPNLRALSLFGTQITDDGIAALSDLSDLETLTVSSPKITSASFNNLVELRRLETLGAWTWKIRDDDIGKLSQLPNLICLDLLTELTDASVPHVVKLGQLEWVRLRGEGITDACLPQFYGLNRLKSLDLEDTSVDKTSQAAKLLQQRLQDCRIRLPKTPEEEARHRAFQMSKWQVGNKDGIDQSAVAR